MHVKLDGRELDASMGQRGCWYRLAFHQLHTALMAISNHPRTDLDDGGVQRVEVEHDHDLVIQPAAQS